MSEEPLNLIQGLTEQIERMESEVIPAYREMGHAGAYVMLWLPKAVESAKQHLANLDAAAMIKSYKQLMEVE